VIRRRLAIHRAEAGPLEDYYRERGLLAAVCGDTTPDAVTATMLEALTAATPVPLMEPAPALVATRPA
jgi:adenylate kinase family enzyme